VPQTATIAEAPQRKICDRAETAQIAAFWNLVICHPTSRLNHNGIELRGDHVPGVGHIVLHQDGPSALVISLVSLGGWLARPTLNLAETEQMMDHVVGELEDIADTVRDAKHIDRAALEQEIVAVIRALLDALLPIENANPSGVRPAWRSIRATDLGDMVASIRSVPYAT